jgi:carboxyl-terminal processing protease
VRVARVLEDKLRKINVSMILLVCGVVLIFAGIAYVAGAASASTGSSATRSLFERLRQRAGDEQLISQALGILKHQYYKNITEEQRKELIYGAIEGMVAKLADKPFEDRFSSFYPPKYYDDLAAQTTGDYAGIGILMGLSADMSYPEVVTVFPGTPAEAAGILPDDLIIYIGEEGQPADEEEAQSEGDTYNMPLYEVASRIKGTPGTKVHLRIARPGQSEFTELDVERAAVHYSSVQHAELIDNNIGYIEITNFAEDTGTDFRSSLEKLISDAGGELGALVIDLRNNSGGLLDSAVEVANCFIKQGLIVSVNQREEQTRVDANPKVKKYDVPIVILVNSNTASASEILAAALKDHGLAKVVGETSFGKGVVQAVNPMEVQGDNVKSALAVTIGEYFTEGNYQIHNKGVEPNIWYNFDSEVSEDPQLKALMDELELKRKEINDLNTELRKYVRSRDLGKQEGIEVAQKLAAGLTVADVPKPAEEEEERNPLVALGAGGEEENAVPEDATAK